MSIVLPKGYKEALKAGELRGRREEAGMHLDGSLTLNPATAQALLELMRWQLWIKSHQLDSFCEAFNAQFGQVFEPECYT